MASPLPVQIALRALHDTGHKVQRLTQEEAGDERIYEVDGTRYDLGEVRDLAEAAIIEFRAKAAEIINAAPGVDLTVTEEMKTSHGRVGFIGGSKSRPHRTTWVNLRDMKAWALVAERTIVIAAKAAAA